MNGKILGFLTAALMAAPLAANAQFTYDFTGVITSSNQDSIAIGSQISGTFTFDYANGDPTLSSGTIGSANWSVASSGCSSVFATTAQVDGIFDYVTLVNPYHPCGPQAVVEGSANTGGAGSTFTASEAYHFSPSTQGGSSAQYLQPERCVFRHRPADIGRRYIGHRRDHLCSRGRQRARLLDSDRIQHYISNASTTTRRPDAGLPGSHRSSRGAV